MTKCFKSSNNNRIVTVYTYQNYAPYKNIIPNVKQTWTNKFWVCYMYITRSYFSSEELEIKHQNRKSKFQTKQNKRTNQNAKVNPTAGETTKYKRRNPRVVILFIFLKIAERCCYCNALLESLINVNSVKTYSLGIVTVGVK